MRYNFLGYNNEWKSIPILAFVWSSFIYIRALGTGFPHPSTDLFVILVLIIIIKYIRKCRAISSFIVLFLSYILISLFYISPSVEFQSYNRLFYFALALSVVSPLFQSEQFRLFRENSSVFFLNISVLVTIISFFCYFLGINLVIRQYDDAIEYIENPNLFAGITSHSMVLGFVSMLSFIYLSYLAFSKNVLIIWVLVFISFLTCLFSASRGALVAGIVGFCYLVSKYISNSRLLLKRLLFVLFVLVISYSYWEGFVDRMLLKSDRIESRTFDSRTEKFEARYKEFCDSPIVGIGFSVINKNYDRIKSSGAIEPGSSWLGLLSMLGIFGFLLFIIIWYKAWRVVWCKKLYLNQALIICFSLHMIVEGYVLSAGSLQCIILWLVIGNSIDKAETLESNSIV